MLLRACSMAVGVLVLALAVTSASAAGPYVLTFMSDPGADSTAETDGRGINNSGQVAGFSDAFYGGNEYNDAFLYSGGTFQRIVEGELYNSDPAYTGPLSATALAINNSGQVAGYYNTNSSPYPNGFLYSNGVMTSLAAGTQAVAINNAGQVLVTNGITGATSVYSGGTNGTYATVPGMYGYGMNDSGVVVGAVGTSAAYYSGGTVTTIPAGSGVTYATAVNSSGQVVGQGSQGSFMYSISTQTYTVLGSGTPLAVNSAGAAVGYDNFDIDPTNPSLGTYQGASLYQNGQEINLTNLISPDLSAVYQLMIAYGINDKGQITGTAFNTNQGTYLAFIATSAVPGDANLDGNVDINDLTIVLTNYNQAGAAWSQGDFNGDGNVDINDLTIVLANYGSTAGSGIKAVPEPSCLVLLASVLAGLLAYAWRKRA